MKHLYIPVLIMIVFVDTSGQTKNIDTAKVKLAMIKAEIKPQIKLNDTLKIELSDKPISIKGNRATQIVIVKEKNSSNSFNTLLPLIFTLTGLIVGFFINRLYEWYINRKRIKKSGKRWNIELKTLEEPLKHQIKSIEEFMLSVAKREWKYDSLELMTTINSDRFSSLDKNDLMDYIDYITKLHWYKQLFFSEAKSREQYDKAVKISNHIHGFIDVLSHNFQMINNKWDEFQDGISATTKKLNQDLETLNIQMSNLNFQIANDTLKIYQNQDYTPFFNLYFQFISQLRQNANYNMHNSQKDFLEPAIIELGKLMKDNRILPITASISILFNDLRAINAEKDYVLDNMTELIMRYNKSLELLPKIIEKLEETVLVRFQCN
nr:hypothetical protein [uncultured Flavobacterium sp.]